MQLVKRFQDEIAHVRFLKWVIYSRWVFGHPRYPPDSKRHIKKGENRLAEVR
jgi:hypothetical protein